MMKTGRGKANHAQLRRIAPNYADQRMGVRSPFRGNTEPPESPARTPKPHTDLQSIKVNSGQLNQIKLKGSPLEPGKANPWPPQSESKRSAQIPSRKNTLNQSESTPPGPTHLDLTPELNSAVSPISRNFDAFTLKNR